MTNPINTQIDTIPYSAEAVANLVALEREHEPQTLPEYMGPEVWIDFGSGHPAYPVSPIGFKWPCPTLTTARSLASLETRVAVALILASENK